MKKIIEMSDLHDTYPNSNQVIQGVRFEENEGETVGDGNTARKEENIIKTLQIEYLAGKILYRLFGGGQS